MNAKSIPKIARFAIAGVVNTAFAYIAFATLTGLGCSDVLAVPAAMTAGVVFNFLSYGKMVFKSIYFGVSVPLRL
jgi:putative flippase GtrA